MRPSNLTNLRLLVLILGLAASLIGGLPARAAPLFQDETAKTLFEQAMEKYNAGAYEEAIPLFQQLLDQYPNGEWTNKAQSFLARSYFNVGDIYKSKKQYVEALENYQQALSFYRKMGSQIDEGITLIYIGDMYRDQQLFVEALTTHQQALTIFQKVNNKNWEGVSLYHIGSVYVDQGYPAKALDNYQQAITVFHQLDEQAWTAIILNGVGDIYQDQERYAEALESYHQALSIWQGEEDRAKEGFILNKIGGVYRDQGYYTEALETYQQALTIHRELGDQTFEGITLSELGLMHYDQGRFDEALKYYQNALAVHRDAGDKRWEGLTLNDISEVYREQGRFAEALEYSELALSIHRQLDDRTGEAAALNNIGLVYANQGYYTEALEAFQQALAIRQEIGSRLGEGGTLDNIGKIYANQGRYAEAFEVYQQALIIRHEVGDRDGEGTTLNNIANLYRDQGRYNEALELYQQALVINRELKDLAGKGINLNNIGGVYNAQGHYSEALEKYQQALVIHREVGDRHGEGIALNNIAGIYVSRGHYSEALEKYQQALVIHREVGDRVGEAITLNNIALVYNNQGRYGEALEKYQQALVIHHEVGYKMGKGGILNNIGVVYNKQDLYEAALGVFKQALAINRDLGHRDGEALTLNNIGKVYEDQRRYSEALAMYKQAMTIAQEVGDQTGQATILKNIGDVYRVQNRYDKALEMYQLALAIDRKLGRRTDEGITLIGIGRVYDKRKHYVKALESYEQAITVLETLRAIAGSEQARASFVAQYAGLYNNIVEILHQQNQNENAFLTTERGRARAFLDSLATGHVQLSDNEITDLLTQEQEAYAQRQALQDDLAKARALTPLDPELVTNLETQLAEAETAYAEAQAAIEARGGQLADLVPGRTKNVLGVAEVQALLNPETTLLSYFILDEQTLVFILTSDSFEVIDLDISREALGKLIADFRDAIELRDVDITQRFAHDLHQNLIAPLSSHLNTPHLAVVPHGLLHYLPFTALQSSDTERYLIQDYVLTTLPSASALPFIQENSRRELTAPLVLGNPITGDFDAVASLATKRDGLGALPYAEKEAKAIADLFDVEPLIGTKATERAVREQVSGAGILHIAAHGKYNPVAPLSSLLALAPDPTANDQLPITDYQLPSTHDGWLTVGEIYGLDLKQTDLVVLSACETQLGELSAGDEVVGLTRSFFFAGTPTVVASLWNVDDAATGELMERFYIHLQGGMGKADALRQAQLDLLEEDAYAHPFYWSAFVMSGDGGEVSDESMPTANTEDGEENDTGSQIPCLGGGIFLIAVVGMVLGFQRKMNAIKLIASS